MQPSCRTRFGSKFQEPAQCSKLRAFIQDPERVRLLRLAVAERERKMSTLFLPQRAQSPICLCKPFSRERPSQHVPRPPENREWPEITKKQEGRSKMRAVALIGGKGTRLRPITQTIPKSMVLLRNKPYVQYMVDTMRAAGLDGIVFSMGYLPEPIQRYFAGRDLDGFP